MIEHPAFTVEDWNVHETDLHLDVLAQTESIFALSNGHIGLRGNFDEGEPHGLPGTYLNSFYEFYPLPYAEVAYGYPESGQTIINVTNGKLIRLQVDDEPFDVRYGTLHEHERILDLRNGVLRRNVLWTSPVGRTIKVSSVRLVSFTQRAIAAISYEVEPIDGPARIVLQSELVANEELPNRSQDPRASNTLSSPLVSEEHQTRETFGLLIHHTRVSGLRMGAAMEHNIEGPEEMTVEPESSPDIARVTITAYLKPGEHLRIIKFLAYGWSSLRSRPAIHDQVMAALSSARLTGWEGLLAEQRTYLDDFWSHADVELEGDPQIQQAVRFALFHVLQAGARGERRPIPAKGLTGPGYDGHAFWDTETFVLPVLTLTQPSASADVLRWRYSILEKARARAHQLGFRGAAFPWRTITGEEGSGYWPASTAAFHINADIAHAVTSYVGATGDNTFEEETGLALLVETARLWRSIGYEDTLGRFRIDGVTGPDEYSAIADNNVYTNLMAQHNLRAAAEAVKRHPEAAQALGVDADETNSWLKAANCMLIPYDEGLGVTPQDDAFTDHEVWNFAATSPEQYPLFLHFPYFDLYRKQVIKQADLVLAMQLHSNAFTAEQKARNFAYYEALTVRDSSLSAATQAVLAAEVGQLQLAYDYLGEAALMDIDDLEHNTRDGLHIASLAGSWIALVAGFGGMRTQNSKISFSPRLPKGISRLAFYILFRDRRLRIEVRETEATYYLLSGSPLQTWHHGEEIQLSLNNPLSRPIPPIQPGPQPEQPAGRAPMPRGQHKAP
ncbi:glycoside hydrolase family 65 protein [Ktedonosporobacter rubrisoli]|uniref:Glycoside hydrolase family 65 protein n=1 Tax=Ktedonosporobacter rubrisoli TaxID=2509675 RepID=A0A4P6JQT5_KTERU|nr:glycosyl hydrolase family 65 protein [Ktedonosporobacter rubrisoli]QBD77797.1 glycoside hydrolase family 65 protein [Ktedonosporobacter rubrisoli]